ncbi:MAG: hypothetical protein DWI00_11205 [Planctomycetota bacterium]|nr:MAG: hypothetical protein DWI00_11205 [Planctomycetota bacterium]
MAFPSERGIVPTALSATAEDEEAREFARIRIILKSNSSDFVSQEFATTMRQTVFPERDRKHQKL